MKHLPAPALAKGLYLLDQLASDGQASLEHLAKKNGWPKSSTLRYLQTLEAIGAARQNSQTLHWHAEKCLKPLSQRIPTALEALRKKLPSLAESTGHCVELYQVESRSIRLIDRTEPEGSEVHILARIGFQRDLRELDATAALYFAFTDLTPPPSAWYWEDGEKTSIPEIQQKRMLERARQMHQTTDHAFNENGIRRHAVPILSENGLIGIVAIAQRLTPRFKTDGEKIARALHDFSSLATSELSKA